MVRIFSRFSQRTGHRRTQSTLDERQAPPSNSESSRPSTVAVAAAAAASHGIEVAVEFKPVEHPFEPLDCDRPVKCPLPEPSILNDSRIWKEQKEQMSANARRRTDLPVMKEEANLESQAGGAKQYPTRSNRMILPSASAPEHNLINMLEECNAFPV